jgi:hypothetical protein
MYVQAKKDPTCQWFPTSYRLTTEDVSLIVNDWEEDWKIPVEKIGHSDEGEEKEKSDEDPDDEKNNGTRDHPGPSTTVEQQPVPEVGTKRKDMGTTPIGGHTRRPKT